MIYASFTGWQSMLRLPNHIRMICFCTTQATNYVVHEFQPPLQFVKVAPQPELLWIFRVCSAVGVGKAACMSAVV
jgi:hypothetical protein